jgi:hypothetical protein
VPRPGASRRGRSTPPSEDPSSWPCRSAGSESRCERRRTGAVHRTHLPLMSKDPEPPHEASPVLKRSDFPLHRLKIGVCHAVQRDLSYRCRRKPFPRENRRPRRTAARPEPGHAARMEVLARRHRQSQDPRPPRRRAGRSSRGSPTSASVLAAVVLMSGLAWFLLAGIVRDLWANRAWRIVVGGADPRTWRCRRAPSPREDASHLHRTELPSAGHHRQRIRSSVTGHHRRARLLHARRPCVFRGAAKFW